MEPVNELTGVWLCRSVEERECRIELRDIVIPPPQRGERGVASQIVSAFSLPLFERLRVVPIGPGEDKREKYAVWDGGQRTRALRILLAGDGCIPCSLAPPCDDAELARMCAAAQTCKALINTPELFKMQADGEMYPDYQVRRDLAKLGIGVDRNRRDAGVYVWCFRAVCFLYKELDNAPLIEVTDEDQSPFYHFMERVLQTFTKREVDPGSGEVVSEEIDQRAFNGIELRVLLWAGRRALAMGSASHKLFWRKLAMEGVSGWYRHRNVIRDLHRGLRISEVDLLKEAAVRLFNSGAVTRYKMPSYLEERQSRKFRKAAGSLEKDSNRQTNG